MQRAKVSLVPGRLPDCHFSLCELLCAHVTCVCGFSCDALDSSVSYNPYTLSSTAFPEHDLVFDWFVSIYREYFFFTLNQYGKKDKGFLISFWHRIKICWASLLSLLLWRDTMANTTYQRTSYWEFEILDVVSMTMMGWQHGSSQAGMALEQ